MGMSEYQSLTDCRVDNTDSHHEVSCAFVHTCHIGIGNTTG